MKWSRWNDSNENDLDEMDFNKNDFKWEGDLF